MGKTISIVSLDKKAFEELFRTHFSPLSYFARGYVKDMDAAKEIVHDVFIQLWNKKDSIDTGRSVKSYLFTSVHNRCLNHIRDRKKFNLNTAGIDSTILESQSEASDRMEVAELEARIRIVMEMLPEKCREIFILSRYHDLKYSEIATKLDLSVKTVEAQISKALKIFREQLKDYMIMIFLLLFL